MDQQHPYPQTTTTAISSSTANLGAAVSQAPLPPVMAYPQQHPPAPQQILHPQPPPPLAAAAGNVAVTATNTSNGTTSTTATNSKKRPLSTVAAATVAANPAASNHPPPPRKGKDGEPLSEKKLRRLEKNRLSARECRRRKREATENMERQINLLEGENLRLRLQLQVGEEAEESIHQEQQKLTEGLDGLLKSGASESEIYAKIEEYKEKFADYGRDRRSAIEFHLRNVERLLKPTQTTSVVLATLQGGQDPTTTTTTTTTEPTTTKIERDDSAKKEANGETVTGTEPAAGAASPFATAAPDTSSSSSSLSSPPPKDSKALFRHLVNILEVTPEQAAALKDSRLVAQEMDVILKETLSVLKELRTRLTQCGEDLETEFNNVRAILTPSQSAKFLVWVAQNKACVHMLNELWSKVYPSSHNSNINDDDNLMMSASGGDSSSP